MIPGNSLTLTPQYSIYLIPDGISTPLTQSYELGGVALYDPSQGMQVQTWMIEIIPNGINGDATISSPTQPPLVLFSLPNFTEISLAFDENMHPLVTYVSQGNAGFYWYDATLPGYRYTALPVGATHPQATLDDKRPTELLLGKSDIIVGYIYSNDLKFRMQRDRYLIEYNLYTNLTSLLSNPVLVKVGMNSKYRLQFDIAATLFQ